jgi:hydroxymethylglutaryl-CoA lyase
MAMRRQLAIWLQGESLHGSIWKAGLPRTLLAPAAEAVAA